MPTYLVTNSNFELKTKQKEEIAKGITKIHNIVTGANTYFAQVINTHCILLKLKKMIHHLLSMYL